MSISNLYPAINPTLNLSFALTKALDPRVTFVRTTTATYYGTETAKAEENLLIRSQEFDNIGVWISSGIAARTANNETAPDGTSTADTIQESSETTVHRIDQTGFSITGLVTLSIFAKLGVGTRFLSISVSDSANASNNGSATFDLSLGTNTQTQVNGTYSSPSATITAVAESFYRCTLTVTSSVASFVRIAMNDTGTPTSSNRGVGANYTGDNTSTLILWGAQLEQRSAVTSYTPTTTQPITNYIPVLETAAAGVARFDHNPTTFESLGLLIEEQRTNLLVRSEEFDDAAWAKTNSSITANTVVAPDGTLTADKVIANTSSGSHRVGQSPSLTDNTFFVTSVYVKAAEYTNCVISLVTKGGGIRAIGVNLTNGSQFVPTGITGAPTFSQISNVGNGWYRVSVGHDIGTGGTSENVRYYVSDGVGISFVGDGYSGIFIWGAQLEEASFSTSYIPTVAATVTRNADVASMTGANFSSWYSASNVGSVYVEANEFGGNNSGPWWLNSGTTGRGIAYRRTSPTGTLEMNYRQPDGTTRATTFTNAVPLQQSNKVAISFNATDTSVSPNGATVAASSSANLYPAVDQLRIGFSQIVGNAPFIWCGTIKKLAFYPSRLTDAQLQALTS